MRYARIKAVMMCLICVLTALMMASCSSLFLPEDEAGDTTPVLTMPPSPSPSPTEAIQPVIMPDVTNEIEQYAEEKLVALGLDVEILYVKSHLTTKGLVCTQSIKAGNELMPGDCVSIYVSAGIPPTPTPTPTPEPTPKPTRRPKTPEPTVEPTPEPTVKPGGG